MKERLIDKVKIYVKGGSGGSGCVSFHREKFAPKGGPDGGSGGDGGNVCLEASESMLDFIPFRYKVHFKAGSGAHGKGGDKQGKRGEDHTIRVPRGTIVFDAGTGDALADIVEPGERYLAARGGRGGRGNAEFTSPARRVPKFAEKGEPGEERWLILELKLLADVGIIGFPNAGKSTLLSKVSAATPKIAPYPFTTLSPNLGVVTSKEGETAIFADLPGLIEGAHKGAGLGLHFLRHVERTKLLLHLLDISTLSPEDPSEPYMKIRNELTLHNPELIERPEIVVFNKIDLLTDTKIIDAMRSAYSGKEIFFISCLTSENIPVLLGHIFNLLKITPAPGPTIQIVEKKEHQKLRVRREDDRFVVEGKPVENLIAMTDLENEYAVEYLQKKFKMMGVEDALTREGAKDGDTVVILNREFDFHPEVMPSSGEEKGASQSKFSGVKGGKKRR